MDKKKILIVDDDQSILSIFEFILQQAGYTIITTTSGTECVNIVRSNGDIDLIFLDLKMPEVSGLEVFRQIQKIRPNLLVVIMTGYTADELLKEAFEMGAYGIIYKPFDVEEVLSIIDKIFKVSS